MGVTYKLKDEVVQFIISQRQGNPLFSCRQLAESASQKFDLHLSKSSVHDVLKEFGVITPRGRKPKTKFQIPIEKKKQIQVSLSQTMLANPLVVPEAKNLPEPLPVEVTGPKETISLSDNNIYEGAGKIFLKAALWDLGIFSQDNIKDSDWNYYLTYTAGVKVVLENGSSYVIDLPLPLQRCIREVSDGLINNIKPFIMCKTSDETLFKASMEAQPGFKINNISLVDVNSHDICYFNCIMENNKDFFQINRVFVDNRSRDMLERAKGLFFSQTIDNNKVMENILNLEGFDSVNKEEYVVTILIEDSYANKIILEQAVERLNGMFLQDEQGSLLKVKISLKNSGSAG